MYIVSKQILVIVYKYDCFNGYLSINYIVILLSYLIIPLVQYTHCIYITPLMYVCLHELLHILCIYYRIYISHTDYIYSPPVCMYVRIYVYKFYSIYYYDYIYNIHTLYTHLYMPAYTHHHLPPSLLGLYKFPVPRRSISIHFVHFWRFSCPFCPFLSKISI